ncbi:MAG: adenylate/guanylate cyclase domain-containing protein [Actinomycetota bacterium]
MQQLPTGTVTFVFSDIEGSTRLLQALGNAYPSVLEQHGALLRESFAINNGVVVSTEGDSFFVVFSSPTDAILAAMGAQRALSQHEWDGETQVNVRMGLHSGDGILGGDNYVGIDVHRAARIMATAYGGQVLISDSTRSLVQNDLPTSVSLADLGEHKLKDLAKAEHIFQLVIEGLPSDFPAIKSLGNKPNNLPAQLTSFIARDQELARIKELFKQARCLSLTGPGGTGKTRLSLELAREVGDDFANGTFFVQLASVSDPNMIATTIAQTLHLPETPGATRSPLARLVEHVSGREMLLVLDNFEQLVAGGAIVSDLLKASPNLKVVITTRVPLHIQGEREYPVPPLALPDPNNLPDAAMLSQYESVALFIERAVTVRPDFKVTNQNAPAIAEICARLDGLPLAIELAAARVRVLTPEALLARLGTRLKLLVGGGTDIPQRQQTLRGAIEWSHDLLDEPERRVFRRFSVFVGGCRLEEAEAVCGSVDLGDLSIDVFEGLSSLVDKSLIKTDESDALDVRFFMLETIREYAVEKLTESDESNDVAKQHAIAYTEFAELASSNILGQHRRTWLDRLERDNDNLAAAHAWGLSNGGADLVLRLLVAVWRFWHMRGYLQEGKQRVDEAMAMDGANQQTALGARAKQAAGSVSHWQGDTTRQVTFYDQAIEIWRKLDDDIGLADALYDRSFPCMAEGQIESGRAYAEESFALAEKVGDRVAVANSQWALASLDAMDTRDLASAESRLLAAMRTFRDEDNAFMQMWILHSLGEMYLVQNKTDAAEIEFLKALKLATEAMDLSGILFQLDNLSASAKQRGDLERAIRLAATVSALKDSSGADLVTTSREMSGIDSVGRDALAADRLEEIWAEAEKWNLDDAIAYALSSE